MYICQYLSRFMLCVGRNVSNKWMYCFQEKILFTHRYSQYRMGRNELSYILKMPPYPFIQVYSFIKDLRVNMYFECSQSVDV